ncbi:MAG TPA: LacI family DNA-binding transcriptional regulator [Tepidisphaeraceae bacterium]
MADRLGVSPMTISYALRGHASVSAAMRERVKVVANELGYRPNSAARAMLSGHFKTVASVYAVHRDGLRQTSRSELLAGYSSALHASGMQLTLAAMDADQSQGVKGKPILLRERAVDGLLIDYDIRVAQGWMEELSSLGVPSIHVNDKQKADCVYPDDFGGAQAATEYLLMIGHRRVLCFIDGRLHPLDEPPAHYSAPDRVAGYRAAMKAAGRIPQVVHAKVGSAEAQEQIRAFLAASDRPTAVLCAGGENPVNIYFCASMAGLRVPNDLSIVTLHYEQYIAPATVATWHIPLRETGHFAVKQLLKKIAAPTQRLVPMTIPYEKVDLGSTVCSPASNVR